MLISTCEALGLILSTTKKEKMGEKIVKYYISKTKISKFVFQMSNMNTQKRKKYLFNIGTKYTQEEEKKNYK
jgi:hypothetical protein